KPESRAKAFLRGNRDLSTDLKFVRVEPYVVPKRSLTGESTERVDTRVLQAIYSFKPESLPVYVGQQMDVFIEAPPLRNVSATNTPPQDSGSHNRIIEKDCHGNVQVYLWRGRLAHAVSARVAWARRPRHEGLGARGVFVHRGCAVAVGVQGRTELQDSRAGD